MLLSLIVFGLIASSSCAQNKEKKQTKDTKTDSADTEIIDIFYESPFEVLEKPKLVLPDSLHINGANGYLIVKIFSDTLGTINKEIEILILKNKRGNRLIEYIRSYEKSDVIEPSDKAYPYIKWARSRLKELKVKRKEELLETKLTSQIMLRINSDK